MKAVSIRKENNDYLVYIYGQRSTMRVNELGAIVLNSFLNESIEIEEIAKNTSEKFQIDYKEAYQDIKDFLNDVYFKLTTLNTNTLEQDFLESPIGAEIEITTACNLRCKHCFQGEYPEKYMEFDKFKEIADILKKNNVYEINLVGGEVFKHKDIIKFLNYLNDLDMAITIVTNAVLIDQLIIKELAKLEDLFILVSLDGTKELHDAIRGKGQFDLIFPKIRALKAAGIKVEILCTLNALNVEKIDDIVKLSDKLDIPINFNLFKPFSERHQSLIVNPKDYFKAIEKLLRMRIKENKKIGVSSSSLSSYMMGLPVKNECTATLSGVVINTDGKMLPCPYLLECGYYSKEELPDFDENFIENWKKGDVFTRFRKNGQKGCQARSYIFSNNVKANDPYDLEAYKNFKEND